LAEGDLTAFEAQWTAYRLGQEREQMRRRAVEWAGEDGVARIEAELAAKGPGYTGRDVWWVAANRFCLEALRRGAWQDASHVYFELALQLYREQDEDRSSPQVLKLEAEAAKAELRAYAAQGVKRVDVSGCGCEVCSTGADRVVPITAELQAPRVPHADCELGWCGCSYLAFVE
jgi:hypothetical protein